MKPRRSEIALTPDTVGAVVAILADVAPMLVTRVPFFAQLLIALEHMNETGAAIVIRPTRVNGHDLR